ncbi:MAG: alkaline phosphatase family protein, partial [Holophaga sp.]|nr:alkaline phosphatase family protein [Holophaga sp.]
MRLLRLFLPCLVVLPLAASRPPLVVVITVDQFSAELMARWGKDLPGGLGRLAREGTAFQSAYQDHGYTETGPGHSVILTGRHPANTGITENRWVDGSTGKPVKCVSDPTSPIVGAPERGASALHFRGTTLGQWVRNQIPNGRSFAMTGKDRASIFMAGAQGNGVYWFEPGLGFTTSTAYAKSLPDWLQAHNRRFLEQAQSRSFFWEASSGQPESGGSFIIRGKPVAFGLPRLIQGVGMPVDAAFWKRFKASPFFDQSILDAAEALIEHEALGRRRSTDLLALSLSASDYVGHEFGNQGPEMRDQVRRLDKALGAFLVRLQSRVPAAWVVLTADHGSGDFPERLEAQGHPAKRLNLRAWGRALNRAVGQRLDTDRALFLESDSPQFHLDKAALHASGKNRSEVLRVAIELARKDLDIVEACSAEEMEALALPSNANPAGRPIRERLRLSFVAGRSGDLLLAFRPNVMIDDPEDPTSHGHPHDEDRRVPLIFWGPWKA